MAAGFVPTISLDSIMEPEAPERQSYRRYRKRRSGFMFPEEIRVSDSLSNLYVGQAENIKEEVDFEEDHLTNMDYNLSGTRGRSSRSEFPAAQIPLKSLEEEDDFSLPVTGARSLQQTIKQEPQEVSDSGESSFSRFGYALQAALQGFLSFPDLILKFEACCKDLAEHVREEATERHRAVEDRLMRQKAQMLHDEAATWSLIWHLFGKEASQLEQEDSILETSQLEACKFITTDETAQLCFRVLKWLEGLASRNLDLEKKKKGWYAGSYLQKIGVWYQTQNAIRKMAGKAVLIQHLDPDAPTREHTRLQSEDQKLEEELLEDIWRLLQAGMLYEARQLCRSAGQPWRAATLGGCGDLGSSPSPETLRHQGRDASLHAVELESGINHQRRLWKWSCFSASEKISETSDGSRYETAIYAAQCGNIRRMMPICKDWESACWAIVKSWLDVQVDIELSRLHPSKTDQYRTDGDLAEMSESIVEFNVGSTTGPDLWPDHVLDQQPRDFPSLFQKLISGDLVHENVSRSCKEQQRQMQIGIILGEVGHLLDLLRSWIVPPEHHNQNWRSHGHPQMIRFGAHLVLVLRHILDEDVKQQFREKLWLVGDLVLNTYAIFLFTQRREELVGIYAAQLAPYLCEELYLHMMELRQNDSALVKYKIFRSALENLPFEDDPLKGCVSTILDKVLSRSRELKPMKNLVKNEEIEEHVMQGSLQKALAAQWLSFDPPPGLENAEQLRVKLLSRAAQHSNVLLCEFALASLRRNITMPVAAHMILGYLVDPLKHPVDYSIYPKLNLQEDIDEIQEWREYFTCDALFRNWLKMELSNAQISALSREEKETASAAAREAIGASSSFLQRRSYTWMSGRESVLEYFQCPEWIELHAVGVLISASGDCLAPDATVCTTLKSSLYSCAGEDIVVVRQLQAEVTETGAANAINVHLRCLPVQGDGIRSSLEANGGLLAAVLASSVKGELDHFQPGLTFCITRLDAWFVDKEGGHFPAIYIKQGLCRQCCLPELILRYMQMKVALLESSCVVDNDEDLVEFIASSMTNIHQLFSPKQLQEFLLLEREYTLQILELAQDNAINL